MSRARILADYVSGGTTAAEFDYLDGVTSNIQTQFTAKAALASPAFTGTPTGITAAHITSGVLPVGVTGGSGLDAVGALNAGSITSGFGAIDTGSSNITTTGTVSGTTFVGSGASLTNLPAAGETAKIWVNFAGNTNTGGNCTVNDSHNVSTVADEGTGLYQVNFSNNMANSDYCVVGMTTGHSADTSYNRSLYIRGYDALETADVEVEVKNSTSGAPEDGNVVCVLVFGELA